MLVSDSICFSLSSEEKKEFLVSGWSLKVEYSGDININNLTLSFSFVSFLIPTFFKKIVNVLLNS